MPHCFPKILVIHFYFFFIKSKYKNEKFLCFSHKKTDDVILENVFEGKFKSKFHRKYHDFVECMSDSDSLFYLFNKRCQKQEFL